MGLFGSIVGGLLGVKKPKKPAFDAGLDEATKIRLQNEADAFVDPVEKYKDQPTTRRQDMRGDTARAMTGGTIVVPGLTAPQQRQRDVEGKYRELAVAHLSNPTAEAAAPAPSDIAPPSIEQAAAAVRDNRFMRRSSRRDNQVLNIGQVLAGFARRSATQMSNRLTGR